MHVVHSDAAMCVSRSVLGSQEQACSERSGTNVPMAQQLCTTNVHNSNCAQQMSITANECTHLSSIAEICTQHALEHFCYLPDNDPNTVTGITL